MAAREHSGNVNILIEGEIVATNVTFDEYMEKYAEHFCEWVNGVVIKMSPASLRHTGLIGYLYSLLSVYFELRPIGIVLQAPFVMKLSPEHVGREPDLQIILNDNPGQLSETAMIGPADICIEVVSPESVSRDHGEKFKEYQNGGVREYWILDPLRDEARFYRLNDAGVYMPQYPDQGIYHTPLLPGLQLEVAVLWQEKLPGPIAIAKSIQAMLK